MPVRPFLAEPRVPAFRDLALNAIVALTPRAVEVFDRYGFDSCCGGAKTLALVCETHGVPLDDVLRDLLAVS